jgi:hypothetical protein
MDTKRCFFIIIIFFVALKSSFSQVNIELNDFFRPWNNYNYLLLNDTITTPQSGANCNWNFNGYSSTNAVNIDVQPINWTDDSTNWIVNSYVLNEANQSKTIVNFSDTSFSHQAFVYGEKIYKFFTPEVQFNLPFNYGESYATNNRAIYSRDTSFIIGLIDSVRNVLTRNRMCQTVGFGNIQIFNQTYAGMLCKETIYSFDTIQYRNSLLGWFNALGIPKIDTTIVYTWYAKNVGAEVAKLTLGANNFKEYRVLKNPPIVSSTKEFSDDVNLFPNPFVSELRIETSEKIERIFVYDLQGKMVHQQIESSNKALIDLNDCENGTYLLEITTTKYKTIKKIIKNKL